MKKSILIALLITAIAGAAAIGIRSLRTYEMSMGAYVVLPNSAQKHPPHRMKMLESKEAFLAQSVNTGRIIFCFSCFGFFGDRDWVAPGQKFEYRYGRRHPL